MSGSPSALLAKAILTIDSGHVLRKIFGKSRIQEDALSNIFLSRGSLGFWQGFGYLS